MRNYLVYIYYTNIHFTLSFKKILFVLFMRENWWYL